MRDYALGIIEVAKSVGCVKLPKTSVHHLSRPFRNTPSTLASDGTPSDEVNDTIGHAIQMDFGNYTIGRLIPDRANYDETNPEYVRVRAKIERRIFDLGYRAQRFKHADSEIGRNSWNSRNEHKVDRYGKKYSWIAYFEMWGERDANRKMPDWRQDCRTSDCSIDPTFPKVPPSWSPPLPDLLGPPAPTTEEWVTGGFTPNWHQLLKLALEREWTVLMVGEHNNMGGVSDKIIEITGTPYLRNDLSVPYRNTDNSGIMRSSDIRAWYAEAMLNRGASVEVFSPLNRVLLSGDGWWAEPDIDEWLWVGDYDWQPKDRHGRLAMALTATEKNTTWVILGDTGPFINQQLVSDPRPALRIIELATLWPTFFRDISLILIATCIVLGFSIS
eukprot:gene36903-48142_t